MRHENNPFILISDFDISPKSLNGPKKEAETLATAFNSFENASKIMNKNDGNKKEHLMHKIVVAAVMDQK